ncbi:ammonium transporter, partial [Lysinibacillus xylanilyticus]
VSGSVAAGLLIIKAFLPLRVSAEEEVTGLDVIEHGAPAYEFQDIFKGSAVRGETFAHRLTHFGKTNNNVQEEHV